MKRTPKKLAALLGLVSTATARPLGAEEADLLTKSLTDYDQTRRQLGGILAKNLPSDRKAVDRVRALHSRYRSALTDEFDCCAHCNQLTADLIPYPCETLRVLEGDVR